MLTYKYVPLCALSRVQLSMTPWTVAHQAPLSMGFPRQEYWNGLPFPSLGDLSSPGIKPMSPAVAGRFFTTEQPGNPTVQYKGFQIPQMEKISNSLLSNGLVTISLLLITL